MSLWVVDSNVISELMRPQPDANVLTWFDQRTNEQFATTAVNQAEVLRGLALMPTRLRKRSMLALAQSIWSELLPAGVLPFDTLAANEISTVVEIRQKVGRPIEFADAAIAAICRVHAAGVVTRDAGGFEHCGIQIINPWQ